MNSIRILSEDVANQIAAGEVIERPASVVRELLDNSIDAGADRISVGIEDGGRKLIRIVDNGSGMNKDDLLLSLERHATSKIRSVSDLFSVNTLGFRGEALPSIASVSRMMIISRPQDQLEGYRLNISGGELKSIVETGSSEGTTIEVGNLFFNTPARRKFLKSSKTESDHIVDTVSRIALPYKHIQLKIENNGKRLFTVPASDNELNRLSVLMGSSVARSLVDVEEVHDTLSVRAYLAPPDMSRSRNDRLFVYINNRSIRDRMVNRAILEGYGQRLMKGRYPQAVIFIDIDSALVDVNVHPAKQEVRFHQSSQVFRTLLSFIENGLKKQFNSFQSVDYVKPTSVPMKQEPLVRTSEPEWEYKPIEDENHVAIDEKATQVPKREYLLKNTVRVIGQLKDTYILCEVRDGLIVVDQHAAHERIVYETLKKSYNRSRVEQQAFLIPQRLELSIKESRIIQEKLDQLKGFGLEIENFGGSTFIVRSVPSLLVNMDWEQFILDLLPILDEEDELSTDKAMDRLLTSMACHGAIRAGKRMSQQEMIHLLEQLERMELPTNCPHGRPIYRKFNDLELEKMFKRVV